MIVGRSYPNASTNEPQSIPEKKFSYCIILFPTPISSRWLTIFMTLLLCLVTSPRILMNEILLFIEQSIRSF